MQEENLLFLALLLILGIFCQWLAWKLKIPAILPLLLAGLILGPVGDFFSPEDALGDSLSMLISIAVAVILFEGALTLHFKQLRSNITTVCKLITIGALVTWLGCATATHYILGVGWKIALLFGAITVVSGPTVITPLIHNVRPNDRISSILRWESILIDPLGAILALLVFDLVAPGNAGEGILVKALSTILIGGLIGSIGAWIVHSVTKRYWLPDYLRDIAILSFVILVFSASNIWKGESGLLAVTVMGIILANTETKQLHEIWHFKEKISILLLSVLFLILAASPSRDELVGLSWTQVILLLVILVLVIRPLSVWLSTVGHQSAPSWKEKIFLSAVCPRGIVAAAIASLFALRLSEMGDSEGGILRPLTFWVILGTVFLQGGTAKWLARKLKISDPDPQGCLIMGANQFSIALAQALKSEGFTVRLVDNNWSNVRQAKLKEIDAYHGNMLSDLLEEEFNLEGIGRLLALTSNQEANGLACLHYQSEFGSSEVYQLPSIGNTSLTKQSQPSSKKKVGLSLFTSKANFRLLQEQIHNNASIKRISLSSQFTYQDFRQKYKDNFIPLFLIKNNGQLQLFNLENPPIPGINSKLFALVMEQQQQ